MALLDNTTQQAYYQSSDFGNYQFVSLTDILLNLAKHKKLQFQQHYK